MCQHQLAALLQENAYPGRGIIAGRSADNQCTVLAYFIMGRSSNSRNRVFVEDGMGIRTQAFDPAKLEDPSLIIYAPVRVIPHGKAPATIVTNGDQTDTIYDYLQAGKTFEQALRARTFEPDAPNYTPRISCVAWEGAYALSILKSAQGNGNSCQRFFYEYAQPLAGTGHFIHTYAHDGNPLPSFEGEPHTISLSGGIDEFSNCLWDNLNEENKVSLFVRYIRLDNGEQETRIFNKNK